MPRLVLVASFVWFLALPVNLARAESLDIGALCEDDSDCAPYPDNPWCDDGMCWRCNDDADCTDPGEICLGGRCVMPCLDDVDCEGEEAICNEDAGHCEVCLSDTDCLEPEYCAGGFCLVDACVPGEMECQSTAIRQCRDNGSGWDTIETCNVTCEDDDSGPACIDAGTSSSTSGSNDSDTGSVGDPPPETNTGGQFTTGAPPDSAEEPVTARGCACRATPKGTLGPLLLLPVLLLPVLLRRRPSPHGSRSSRPPQLPHWK